MLEKIRTIIADQLSVEESSIQPETSLTIWKPTLWILSSLLWHWKIPLM